MAVKQVSVFLENSKGRVYNVAEVLSGNGINMIGISIADTTDFGILRIMTADPDKALKVLKEQNFIVELTDVIAICVEDRPGGMAEAFKILADCGIEVDYLYAIEKGIDDYAVLIIKTENIDAAEKSIAEGGIKLLSKDEFYSL